jgi:hypothetical protein
MPERAASAVPVLLWFVKLRCSEGWQRELGATRRALAASQHGLPRCVVLV